MSKRNLSPSRLRRNSGAEVSVAECTPSTDQALGSIFSTRERRKEMPHPLFYLYENTTITTALCYLNILCSFNGIQLFYSPVLTCW